jgi:pyrroline-5-carboxylate reductase
MATSIGFIGTGHMGSAIIKGLAGKDFDIHGIDLNRARVEQLAAEYSLLPATSVRGLVAVCDYVVLAVKPQHAAAVLAEAAPELNKGRCLISIAAGIPLARLKEWSEARCPVVRVMPNTPALVGAGVFALCLDDPLLSGKQKKLVHKLFGLLGETHALPEHLFDAYTAVVGCGPAYVFYFMEALVEVAVNLGFGRDLATHMVKGLFTGSARLAVEGGHHLSLLREMVTSPAGSTVRALHHMDKKGVRGQIMEAVIKAYKRNRELGE